MMARSAMDKEVACSGLEKELHSIVEAVPMLVEEYFLLQGQVLDLT